MNWNITRFFGQRRQLTNTIDGIDLLFNTVVIPSTFFSTKSLINIQSPLFFSLTTLTQSKRFVYMYFLVWHMMQWIRTVSSHMTQTDSKCVYNFCSYILTDDFFVVVCMRYVWVLNGAFTMPTHFEGEIFCQISVKLYWTKCVVYRSCILFMHFKSLQCLYYYLIHLFYLSIFFATCEIFWIIIVQWKKKYRLF